MHCLVQVRFLWGTKDVNPLYQPGARYHFSLRSDLKVAVERGTWYRMDNYPEAQCLSLTADALKSS